MLLFAGVACVILALVTIAHALKFQNDQSPAWWGFAYPLVFSLFLLGATVFFALTAIYGPGNLS